MGSEPEPGDSRSDACPICRQDQPLHVIAELDQVWVTAPPDAPLPGYVCLVSRTHVREPFELAESQRTAFWRDVDRVAKAIDAGFRPAKLNYEIHGNTIEHLHVHLFPRYAGDPFEGRPIDPRETVRRDPAEIDRLRLALTDVAASVEEARHCSRSAVVIRSQRPEDAEALVDVHLRSWRWAYTGLIPDDYIDLLWSQRDERVERTRRQIREAAPDERYWLAARDGAVVGLCYTHASGDEGPAPDTAEVGALYLAPEAAGRGVGRALLFRRATLWVLDANARARRFYEAAGWRSDGASKVEERPGAALHEVRYAVDLGSGSVPTRRPYDPAEAAAFYDAYGDREWTRFADGRTSAASLEIHRHYLRRFVTSGDRVLEVGAGPGRFTIELAALGARIVVADISLGQLERNRAKVAEAGAEHAVEARVVADIVDLSQFPDGAFDAVVCYGGPLSYVLERADDAIAELLRATKPGGAVLLSVMSLVGAASLGLESVIHDAKAFGVAAVDEVIRTGDLPSEFSGGHLRMHMFRWSELERLLSRHGARILAASASSIGPVRDQELLDSLDASQREALIRWEIELGSEPGAIDTGAHIIAVVEKRGTRSR